MIAALLFALQATPPPAAAGPPAGPQAAQDLPSPIDWEALPPLNYRNPPTVTPAMQAFVAGEVAAGRCAPPRGPEGHYWIKLDVAVLVDGEGHVLRVLPHAIDCPTVEQFGAGLALSFARENLLPRTQPDDRWFRATFVFTRP
jgi:hypothetical protein